jgi:spore coat polysaccharide biosynthesis protein SpsF
MANIVCIVQARMGSTRLPGKVLLDLCGHTVLYHVINRIKESTIIDNVVVATSTNEIDNVILDECRLIGVDYFCGSENDVLDRYYRAAIKYGATDIVRVTSDCPLIDPNVIDIVIGEFIKERDTIKYDYACNVLSRKYPRGLDVEIFSMRALTQTFEFAIENHQREHVTPYIFENPDKFNLLSIQNNKNESSYRWTLDVDEDYEMIKNIYESLWKEDEFFGKNIVIDYLKKNPLISKINENIKQKEFTTVSSMPNKIKVI